MSFVPRRMPAVVLVLALVASPATARSQVLIQRPQDSAPVIARLSPAGLRRGQSAEITVEGDRLDGLKDVLCETGVRLLKVLEAEPKRARLMLEVAADALPGIVPFHVLCKAGLSNPRLVRLDDLAQLAEQEDNNSLARASPISVPAAVNGTLTRADVDYFRFDASAGQQLVFEIEAHRIGSALQPVLTLYNTGGREIQTVVTPSPDIAPDVRLAHSFSEAGSYVVRVSDLTFQGSDFTVYHLRIDDIPFAATMFPLGGRRGTVVPVTLEGGNLPQPIAHQVDLSGEVPWRQARLTVPTPRGPLSSPALFAVGEHPEIEEREPNNDPAAATRVELPVTINGRIDPDGDRDCFRFRAAAGARVIVRVLAQQLGSPLDSMVAIGDEAGAQLAAVDDRPAADREPPVVRPLNAPPRLDDAVVDFTAPKEGDYTITLDDLSLRGGKAFAYRLEVAPPQPDFELLVQPGRAVATPGSNSPRPQEAQRVLNEFAGQGTGALSIDRGGSGVLVVRALRSGYDGPITLSVEGLPPGVQGGQAVIPAGQNQAVLNLVADFDADSCGRFVRVNGTATLPSGGPAADPAKQAGPQTTWTRPALQPVVFSALPVNGAVQHPQATVALGVSAQGAELAIRGQLDAPLAQGTTALLRISLRRREGYAGDVSARIANLPTGLAAPGVTIATGADRAEVNLTAGLDVTPGKRSVLLEGTLKVAGRDEPVVATFPLELDVLPLVVVELPNRQIAVAQGGEVSLDIRVRRHGPLAAAIKLAISGLPKGVSAGPLEIPSGVEQFSLVLQADSTAAASPIRRLVQVKATTKVGDQTLELPSLRFALQVTKR